jgi:TrmH family RNA methyltransferase
MGTPPKIADADFSCDIEVSFILVKPKYPSNMGMSARALQAFGHQELIFVNPERSHLHERALLTATFGESLLREAKIANSCAEACQGLDCVVATTNKSRSLAKPDLPAERLLPWLLERGVQKVALLFGPEASGLSNEDIASSDAISHIPTSGQGLPLNLAQAVSLYAYLLRKKVHHRRTKKAKEQQRSPSESTLTSLPTLLAEGIASQKISEALATWLTVIAPKLNRVELDRLIAAVREGKSELG